MRDNTCKYIDALLNFTNDNDKNVCESIVQSIIALGSKEPIAILEQSEKWLSTHKISSTSEHQRYLVIKIIIGILQEHNMKLRISSSLRDSLLNLAFKEMTAVIDLNSEWAKEACNLYIDLTDLFPKEGCFLIINSLTTQSLPHFFTIDALAIFADEHPLRFLPYLKEAISKILPILNLARQDNYRMLLSKALGSFADAVLQLETRNDDSQLTPRSKECIAFKRSDFFDTMYTGIQFLIGEWSRVNDGRARVNVFFAIGSMFPICSDENRIALIPKVIPLMITGMKKEKPKDQLLVARGFSCLFTHCSDVIVQALEPHMDNIMQVLVLSISAASQEITFDPFVSKTLNFLLQTAEHIALFHLNGLIIFLSKNIDIKSNVKDSAIRASCLQIFRHLISRKMLCSHLRPFIDNIIATVKLSINDTDLRVRKALALTIISMGTSDLGFFDAIGSSELTNFIITNSAIPDHVIDESKKNKMPISLEELRDTCRNTLTLFSASNERLDTALWPFLLEHLGHYQDNPNLVNAFYTICRCLIQLNARISKTDYYYVDFNAAVNVPKPYSIVVKLLVQAMQFEIYKREVLHVILEGMSVIAPILDEPFLHSDKEEIPTPIGSLWLGTIPELQKLLTQESLTPESWEDYLCRLVSKTLQARETESWIEECTTAATSDLKVYQSYPTMFRSCLIIIGVGLGRCSKKDYVMKTIDTIVDLANHDHHDHIVGLSKAFGFISQLHPDISLDKLSILAKGPEKRGLFDKKTAKKKELTENSRLIAAFGFCYTAKKMPSSILASRLDAVIISSITSILNNYKTSEIRDKLLECIPLLETPIEKINYNFIGRDTLIETIIQVCDTSNKTPLPFKSILLGFKSIASLIKMATSPIVSSSLQAKITSFAIIFLRRQLVDYTPEKESEYTMVIIDTLKILFKHNEKMLLGEMLTPFLAFFASVNTWERYRSTLICAHLVKYAVELVQESLKKEISVHCSVTIGNLLGYFVPRFMDTFTPVRMAAFDGINGVVQLTNLICPDLMESNKIDINSIKNEIENLKQRVVALVKDGTTSAEKESTSIIKGFCSIIVSIMTEPVYFIPFLDILLKFGLLDLQEDAASCSCIIMHGMIKGLGHKLPEDKVKIILKQLIGSIENVAKREQVLNGLLVSIRNLTKHHNILCFNELLNCPTPHSDSVIKSFHAIASDNNLSSVLLQHCLDTILNSQLVENKDEKKIVKGLVHIPFSAACALGWICQTAKGAEAAMQIRGSVFGAIALYLTLSYEIDASNMSSHIVVSLKHFLMSTSLEITLDRIERVSGWDNLLDQNKYLNSLIEITKYLCREEFNDTNEFDRGIKKLECGGLDIPPSEPTTVSIEIAQFILPYLNSPIRAHRRIAIAISAALLRHSLNEKRLIQSIVTGLLGRTGSDESALLKAEALTSFKEIILHQYDSIQSYISPIISALLFNIDVSLCQVAEAAIITLYQIISNISNKTQIASIIINILIKVKTLFESQNVFLRRESYHLFGYLIFLTNSGEIDKITMNEQINMHLVTIIIHLEDDNPEVRTEVKEALQQAAKFLEAQYKEEEGKKAIRNVFSKQYMLPIHKTQIEDFLNDFCYVWIKYFPGRINDLLLGFLAFFNNERDCLRLAAVIACGYMFKHIPSEDMTRANIDQTCNALIGRSNQGNEKNPQIRAFAIKSLGMMVSL